MPVRAWRLLRVWVGWVDLAGEDAFADCLRQTRRHNRHLRTGVRIKIKSRGLHKLCETAIDLQSAHLQVDTHVTALRLLFNLGPYFAEHRLYCLLVCQAHLSDFRHVYDDHLTLE